MQQVTVIWISFAAGVADQDMARAMASLGAKVVHASAEHGPVVTGDVRVLRTTASIAESDLRDCYASDRRPTLLIAEGVRDEGVALDVAEPRDDVVRGPIEPQLLMARLSRLLRRNREAESTHRDMLTGLPNRRALARAVRRALAEMLPGEERGLVVIDIDHFKQINDRYGHAAGDQVLVAVANALTAGASPDDLVARVGADQFAVLMTRYDAQTLISDANNLLKYVATPIEVQGVPDKVSLTSSAGLAVLRPQLTEPRLYQQAESAMTDAKALGRARLIHFEFMTDASVGGAEADLQRFTEVTQFFSDRLARMVGDMGRRLVEGARRQALQDALTGTNNRRYFDERLAREMALSHKSGRPLSLALIDVDDFHGVNVEHGWPSGDAVLRAFAAIAASRIRLVDWLARYGGEEFCVVMPDTGIEEARDVAERIRAAVASHEFMSLDGKRIPMTISVGLAELRATAEEPVALVERASKACLVAKRSGKNRVVFEG